MALLGAVSAAMPARASAIQTTPSVPSKIDGAFLITGYAFQGNNLLYVQVENTSRQVASIDGWRLETVWTGGGRLYDEVTPRGLVAPGAKVIIADHTVVPSASVLFSNSANVSPIRLTGIRLLAPSGSSLNDSAVTVATTDTGSNPTPRVAASPPIFYFSRNTSSATGSYLTTFAAFTPNQYTQEEGDSFTLQSDGFYEAPSDTGLRIVEIYAKPMECSPLSLNELCREYVKIFNPTDEPLLLGPYRLRSGSSGQSSTSSNTYALPNLLLPAKTYITYPLGLVDSGAWVWLEDAYGVRMYETTMVQYPSFSSKTGMSWALHGGSGAWQWSQYPSPYNTDNVFSVGGVNNSCDGVRISEIAANHSNQFIELHNQSTESIDISGCQLQTNRSETARYVFPNETFINADDYIAVYVNQSGLSLTKTTTGTVYLLSSDGATEVDVKSYENLNEGTSLSLIGGMWRQTFAVTPGANNQYEEFLPCAEGYIRNTETGRCNKRLVATVAKPCLSTQYRSEETGRCRNVTANSSSLKACEPHQYRNPETNRCRNITTSTSTLQPCRANQYRSVETNRCRNVATAATTLKPCAANQERNPETNRCRAKKQSVAADFPIDTVKDSAEATLGWWAFGGVGLLALGYAGWEWRSEVLAVIRKGISVIPTGR